VNLREDVSSDGGRDRRSSLRYVVEGSRRRLALLAGSSFVGGLLEAVFLVLVTRAAFAITDGMDRVGVVAGFYLTGGQVLALGAALVVTRFAIAAWVAAQSATLTTSVVAALRQRLVEGFLDAEWELQQAQRSGSLQQLVSGFAQQANALMTSLTQAVVAAANVLALLGTAIAVDPLGAVVLVVALLLLSVVIRPLRTATRRRARAQRQAELELATAVSETSSLGLELHVFNVQPAARERLERLIQKSRAASRSVAFLRGLTAPTFAGLAYVAVLAALAFVAADRTSLASLGAAMLVMLRSLGYGQALQTALTSIAAAAPSIDLIRDRLDELNAAHRPDGGQSVGSFGALSMRNVTFAYRPDEPVLRDITFEVAAGEIVGVVGPSGSGKSTLVELMLGLRVPQKGSVLADGRDIRSFDQGDWARRITFVPQESHLITGTVEENIRFMRSHVPAERIEVAARLAHLHDDVTAMPGGYARQVGEQGGALSGGQRQRLCIARALVENPDVLILDEPTSALDARSENLVRVTLEGLRSRMTVVVIAHRLSTLDICDRIMVIQNGRLMAFDSPQRLQETSSFYREALALSQLQS
jgi:ABC-type multidrug transport system fused ATPase/permease subunit